MPQKSPPVSNPAKKGPNLDQSKGPPFPFPAQPLIQAQSTFWVLTGLKAQQLKVNPFGPREKRPPKPIGLQTSKVAQEFCRLTILFPIIHLNLTLTQSHQLNVTTVQTISYCSAPLPRCLLFLSHSPFPTKLLYCNRCQIPL